MKKTSYLALTICALTSCQYIQKTTFVKYKDDIKNPANFEYVRETAFNLNIPPGEVTQRQFNQRYGIKNLR